VYLEQMTRRSRLDSNLLHNVVVFSAAESPDILAENIVTSIANMKRG
jgi:hypothetical protein